MNRFNELVKEKLSKILKEDRENNVVIVLKGISLEVLNELGIFFPTIIDGNKLSHTKICSNNTIIPRLYSEQNLVLLWEEFAYLIEILEIRSSGKYFRIIEDNSRKYYPNEGNENLLIFNGGEIEIDDENIENTLDVNYFPYKEFIQNESNSFILYNESPLCDNVEVVKLFNDSLVLNNIEKVPNFGDVLYCSTPIELDQNFYKIVNEELNPADIIINYQEQNDLSKTFPFSQISNWILKKLYGCEIRIRPIEFNELKKDENISDAVYDLLRKFWGEDANFRKFECYRNAYVNKDLVEINQGIIVQNIIDQCDKAEQGQSFRDIFITASTGSGKSLLFQMPSFYNSINKQRITIVISPLIALMKDQVQGILDRGFNKVCYINSELSYDERLKIFQNIKLGNIDLVYLSPELIGSLNILEIVGDRKIAMVVVDEAHTVTTWGQEFRVEYWYLGHYLKKIRNEINRFPIITLTATAIFSGKLDMVEDIILYLRLINPEIYLGSIKRKSIDFRIENYGNVVGTQLSDFKRNQVIEFVNQAIGLNKKAIIYFPFAKDIDTVYNLLVATDRNNDCLNNIDTKVFRYFSKMLAQEKNDSYVNFKNIPGSIMLATKAFGMGVDISDIEIIYHLAPSGSVSDYIQEIGRVARADEKRGYAMIQFGSSDLYYSKLLFQLSSIKKWQLQIALDKLKKLFNNYASKKLFISTDDFEFIFKTNNDRKDNTENKVLSAMLMIENDFIKDYGFPVFLARPQKMYAKAYGKIRNGENYFGINNEFTELIKKDEDWIYVRVSLDRLWKQQYHDKSLYEVKSKFYNSEIILNEATIYPQLKFTFKNYVPFDRAIIKINNLFDFITNLDDVWMFWSDLNQCFINNGYSKYSSLLTSFLVNRFSISYNYRFEINTDFHLFYSNEVDGKIQYKKSNNGISKLKENIISVINHFNNSFLVCGKSSCDIFISYSEPSLELIKLSLQLFEILDVGTVEISGGESQVLALYINDINRFNKKATSINYQNSIASKQYERHCSSNEFFNYFFTENINDYDRWNVIEDYFLGKDLNYIKQNYVSNGNKIDNIFDGISCTDYVHDNTTSNVSPKFTPIRNHTYLADEKLTFIVDNEFSTRKIDEWIRIDPVLLHRNLSQIGFMIDSACYKALKENLRKYYLDYYSDNFQNNPSIVLNGRSMVVSEWIRNRPDEFYIALSKNSDLQNHACLSSKNKFDLFGNVDQARLSQKDRSWLEDKRKATANEKFNITRRFKLASLLKMDPSDDLNKYLKYDSIDLGFAIFKSNIILVEVNICKFNSGEMVDNESRIICKNLCKSIYERLNISVPDFNTVNILILLRRDLEFIDQNLHRREIVDNLNLCREEDFCNKLFIYLWNNRSIY